MILCDSFCITLILILSHARSYFNIFLHHFDSH
nr:MAG TPA: hypothetical protein [Caudoviricetes sp.]